MLSRSLPAVMGGCVNLLLPNRINLYSMKQKDQTDNLNISQDSIFGSTKRICHVALALDIRVPMRRIALSDTIDEEGVRHNNGSVVVYDTSAPTPIPTIMSIRTKGYLRYASSGSRSRAMTRPKEQSFEYGRKRRQDTSLEHLRFAHLNDQPL